MHDILLTLLMTTNDFFGIHSCFARTGTLTSSGNFITKSKLNTRSLFLCCAPTMAANLILQCLKHNYWSLHQTEIESFLYSLTKRRCWTTQSLRAWHLHVVFCLTRIYQNIFGLWVLAACEIPNVCSPKKHWCHIHQANLQHKVKCLSSLSFWGYNLCSPTSFSPSKVRLTLSSMYLTELWQLCIRLLMLWAWKSYSHYFSLLTLSTSHIATLGVELPTTTTLPFLDSPKHARSQHQQIKQDIASLSKHSSSDNVDLTSSLAII